VCKLWWVIDSRRDHRNLWVAGGVELLEPLREEPHRGARNPTPNVCLVENDVLNRVVARCLAEDLPCLGIIAHKHMIERLRVREQDIRPVPDCVTRHANPRILIRVRANRHVSENTELLVLFAGAFEPTYVGTLLNFVVSSADPCWRVRVPDTDCDTVLGVSVPVDLVEIRDKSV